MIQSYQGVAKDISKDAKSVFFTESCWQGKKKKELQGNGLVGLTRVLTVFYIESFKKSEK